MPTVVALQENLCHSSCWNGSRDFDSPDLHLVVIVVVADWRNAPWPLPWLALGARYDRGIVVVVVVVVVLDSFVQASVEAVAFDEKRSFQSKERTSFVD